MKSRFLIVPLVGAMLSITAVPTAGESRWSRVAPPGAGFSIDAPGEAQPSEPGQYVYSSGWWFLSVKLLPVAPTTRQLLERRERKAVLRCLESVRDSMVTAVTATAGGSSSGDVDGYPSLQFSFANEEFEGTNLAVITAEHLYLVMAVGPKGSRDADAKRFVKSFRLVTTDSRPAVDSHVPNLAPTSPIAAKLGSPMMTVARLIVEERNNLRIDEVLQQAPPAQRLGNRWNPSNAAWQEARTSFTRRINRIVDAYEKSGDAVRTLEAEFAELAPPSQTALAAALEGPAGPAIVRQLALFQFTSMMMDDPNGPSPGDPAWKERLRALKTVFDQRIGSAVSPDDRSHDTDVEAFFSAQSSDASRLCTGVVARATREIESAINLMMFDESQSIGHEIETVIARAK
jgi:hypothetical protein